MLVKLLDRLPYYLRLQIIDFYSLYSSRRGRGSGNFVFIIKEQRVPLVVPDSTKSANPSRRKKELIVKKAISSSVDPYRYFSVREYYGKIYGYFKTDVTRRTFLIFRNLKFVFQKEVNGFRARCERNPNSPYLEKIFDAKYSGCVYSTAYRFRSDKKNASPNKVVNKKQEGNVRRKYSYYGEESWYNQYQKNYELRHCCSARSQKFSRKEKSKYWEQKQSKERNWHKKCELWKSYQEEKGKGKGGKEKFTADRIDKFSFVPKESLSLTLSGGMLTSFLMLCVIGSHHADDSQENFYYYRQKINVPSRKREGKKGSLGGRKFKCLKRLELLSKIYFWDHEKLLTNWFRYCLPDKGQLTHFTYHYEMIPSEYQEEESESRWRKKERKKNKKVEMLDVLKLVRSVNINLKPLESIKYFLSDNQRTKIYEFSCSSWDSELDNSLFSSAVLSNCLLVDVKFVFYINLEDHHVYQLINFLKMLKSVHLVSCHNLTGRSFGYMTKFSKLEKIEFNDIKISDPYDNSKYPDEDKESSDYKKKMWLALKQSNDKGFYDTNENIFALNILQTGLGGSKSFCNVLKVCSNIRSLVVSDGQVLKEQKNKGIFSLPYLETLHIKLFNICVSGLGDADFMKINGIANLRSLVINFSQPKQLSARCYRRIVSFVNDDFSPKLRHLTFVNFINDYFLKLFVERYQDVPIERQRLFKLSLLNNTGSSLSLKGIGNGEMINNEKRKQILEERKVKPRKLLLGLSSRGASKSLEKTNLLRKELLFALEERDRGKWDDPMGTSSFQINENKYLSRSVLAELRKSRICQIDLFGSQSVKRYFVDGQKL